MARPRGRADPSATVPQAAAGARESAGGRPEHAPCRRRRKPSRLGRSGPAAADEVFEPDGNRTWWFQRRTSASWLRLPAPLPVLAGRLARDVDLDFVKLLVARVQVLERRELLRRE